jgi:hypothetical protein
MSTAHTAVICRFAGRGLVAGGRNAYGRHRTGSANAYSARTKSVLSGGRLITNIRGSFGTRVLTAQRGGEVHGASCDELNLATS